MSSFHVEDLALAASSASAEAQARLDSKDAVSLPAMPSHEDATEISLHAGARIQSGHASWAA